MPVAVGGIGLAARNVAFAHHKRDTLFGRSDSGGRVRDAGVILFGNLFELRSDGGRCLHLSEDLIFIAKLIHQAFGLGLFGGKKAHRR